ncbi:MAG: glycosyltransferase [Chloroflexota bacterium]
MSGPGGAAPPLGAVVVHHRTPALLRRCLLHLAASTTPPERIVVVDNESDPDALTAAIAGIAGIAGLILRPDPGNKGYSASCTAGAAAAGTPLLLFLNADTAVDADCIARCTAALLADPGIGIVTARLERPDGRLDHACHRGPPTVGSSLAWTLGLGRRLPRSRRLAGYTLGWLDPATDHDIGACSGAFLLIRAETLRRVGGWDGAYRFYGEDLDLCARVRAVGLRVHYVGTARAIHEKGASSAFGLPEAALDPKRRAARARLRADAAAAHLRYFHLHVAPATGAPARWLAHAWLALGVRRAERVARRAERAARAADGTAR